MSQPQVAAAREHGRSEDNRYRMAVCLRHQLHETPVGWECRNQACLVEAPRGRDGRPAVRPRRWAAKPPQNGPDQIGAVLRNVQDNLEVTLRRRHVGGPLPEKGVQGFSYDDASGQLVVDLGLNRIVIGGRRIAGRRTFSVSGDTPPAAVQYTGIDNNVNNPADTEQQFDTTAANRSFKAFDAGFATISGAQVTPVIILTQSTWTEADNPGPKTFVLKRIGLADTNDNVAQTIYSMLGGTTPSNILNLDFTGLTTFTLKIQVQVTLSSQSAQ